MKNSINFNCNLNQLNIFARQLANVSIPSDIFLLKGDLGSGKTTFSRLFIKALHNNMKIIQPKSIKSPTFPIMISYDLKKYELYHYDFYRLKSFLELKELGIFDNFQDNISIIEWPEILLRQKYLNSYYLIRFKIENLNLRKIKIIHTDKKLSLNIND